MTEVTITSPCKALTFKTVDPFTPLRRLSSNDNSTVENSTGRMSEENVPHNFSGGLYSKLACCTVFLLQPCWERHRGQQPARIRFQDRLGSPELDLGEFKAVFDDAGRRESCSRYKRGDESERKKAKRVDEERSEEEREAKILSLSLSISPLPAALEGNSGL